MIISCYMLLNVIFRNRFPPHAAAIDSDSNALMHSWVWVSWVYWRCGFPSQWGGLAVSEETFHTFPELVARYSGALAFLQTQHQSAAANSFKVRTSFKQKYLPHLSNGQILLGVGFSHLRACRRSADCSCSRDWGYQLQGHVPWVTGFGLFQSLLSLLPCRMVRRSSV